MWSNALVQNDDTNGVGEILFLRPILLEGLLDYQKTSNNISLTLLITSFFEPYVSDSSYPCVQSLLNQKSTHVVVEVKDLAN